MNAPIPDVRSEIDLTTLVPLDDTSIDWNGAVEVTYLLHQSFRYEYPGPIADLHHRLVVVPRERHGDQIRLSHRVDSSAPASEHIDADDFGNPVVTFFARRVDSAIEFTHWSLVTRTFEPEPYYDAAAYAAPEWRTPTALTAADGDLREVAKALRDAHPQERELAQAIVEYVFAEMRYVADSTNVETTAAEAFAQRRGVCQDFAHIAIALARRCGLAARYVSGHLIGEGGTHAWMEFIVGGGPEPEVIAYDPTHDRLVSHKYVVVSIGRDYADVAPTSGVFTAPYSGELTAKKRVGATHVRYATPA